MTQKHPGLDTSSLKVQSRFKTLVLHHYLVGQLLIKPTERNAKTVWEGLKKHGPVTKKHYSFALPQIPKSGGRRAEWRFNMNGKTPFISDRNLGTASKPQSL